MQGTAGPTLSVYLQPLVILQAQGVRVNQTRAIQQPPSNCMLVIVGVIHNPTCFRLSREIGLLKYNLFYYFTFKKKKINITNRIIF